MADNRDTRSDGDAFSGSGAVGERRGDAGCRVCGQEGHFARECPEKPASSEGCFNCGEEGHSKVECTNPRKFMGECRICKETGHPAAECSQKPTDLCNGCKKEGHKIAGCTEPRALTRDNVEAKTPGKAWDDLVAADKTRDLDDVRNATQVYVKAIPGTTWSQLEKSFRANDFNTHLIAYEKEITDTYTLMDLQGNIDQKYYIGFYFSAKPQRGLMKEAWPATPEVNQQRLKEAGTPVERGIPKCSNCDKLGHISKSCLEDKVENTDRASVHCVNCNEGGHRARDCTQPRKDRFACRNCNQSGHQASECTEPRSAANVDCKYCSEIGHFSKDCPTKPKQTCNNCGEEGHIGKECESPRNMAIQICRNCDEKGHISRECPKARDYSRIKCQNCDQMGHTRVKCKASPRLEMAGFHESLSGEPASYRGDGDKKFAAASGGGGSEINTPAAADDGSW